MSCERFRAAITAHAAGAEIDGAAARHLDACAACRQRFATQQQFLAELDGELQRSLSVSASPEFAARVTRATQGGVTRAARRPWVPTAAWAGLAMAAAIVLAVWVGRVALNEGTQAAFRLKPEATKSQGAEATRSQGAEATRSRGAEATTTGNERAEARVPTSAAAPSPSRHGASAFRRKSAAPAPLDPPVIVEPTQLRAIARLRELVVAGRLKEDMLPPVRTPEAALAELAIAPLEVAEIRVGDVEIVNRPPAAPDERQ